MAFVDVLNKQCSQEFDQRQLSRIGFHTTYEHYLSASLKTIGVDSCCFGQEADAQWTAT